MENLTKWPLAISSWDSSELDAISRVMNSGKFTMGEEVKGFEQKFADKFSSRHALMVNSGSSANLLALSAMKISHQNAGKPLGVVVAPAVSWSTTFYPINQAGFSIKFMDVDKDTFNLDINKLKNYIRSQPISGIVTVNLLGNPSDLEELRFIANEESCFLIEDNCESMGAKVGTRFAGTWGDIGTFSTFFSHHISTMEGGLCLTESEIHMEVLKSLRAHGWLRDLPIQNSLDSSVKDPWLRNFRFVLPGYNVRPLEISGAIGSEQLLKFDQIILNRRKNYKKLSSVISKYSWLHLQYEHGFSSWFGFGLVLNSDKIQRKDLIDILKGHQIETRPIAAGNFANNPVMKFMIHERIENLEVSEVIDKNGFYIANHGVLLNDQIEKLDAVLEEVSYKFKI